MRLFSFPTRPVAIICACLYLTACSFDSDLREFRDSVPRVIAGLEWPLLSPIGEFAPRLPPEVIPDPRGLAQRAADLRQRASSLLGPVIEPARKRAMQAALRRYNQG